MSYAGQVNPGAPGLHRYAARRSIRVDQVSYAFAAIVVFLSPYNVLRLPFAYITAADIFAMLGLIFLFWTRSVPRAPFGRFTYVWYTGYLCIFAGLVIGAIANHRLPESLPALLQYTFALICLPWLIARLKYDEALRLVSIFAISVVMVFIHGAWLIHMVEDPSYKLVSGSGRLQTVIERENAAGVLAAVAVIFILHLSSENRWPIWAAIPAIALLGYGIMLTGSNTGLIAFGAGVVLYSLLRCNLRHLQSLACIVLLLIGALAFGGKEILPETFQDRVLKGIFELDPGKVGTLEARLKLNHEGWMVAHDHVLIGLGPDGFRQISEYKAPVHNTFLLLLIEGGLLSLAGLVILIGGIIMFGLRLVLDRTTNALGATLLTSMVTFALILNAFAHIYARFWLVPVILTLALAISGIDQTRKANANQLKRYLGLSG